MNQKHKILIRSFLALLLKWETSFFVLKTTLDKKEIKKKPFFAQISRLKNAIEKSQNKEPKAIFFEKFNSKINEFKVEFENLEFFYL